MEQDADTLTDGEFHRSAVRPNDTVGRYTVLDRLGFGGMGIVFLAHDPELERHVAIKVLHRDPRNAELAARRLMREARTMARLVHPNVVAVHDVGTHRGHVFVAMEYVRGSDLRAWMRRPHSWRDVAQVMLQAARGLAAAHAAGIVHRDFKPDNVMVDRSGRACVTDFGMAAAGRDEEPVSQGDVPVVPPDASVDADPLTHTAGPGGTPAYLAPELFEGQRGDAASDQFAYCVSFFEALWGVRPFAGTSAAQVAVHVLSGEVQMPEDLRGVPRGLRRVVLRGLAVDPQQRWPSMAALGDAIARELAGRRTRLRYVGVGAVLAGAAVGSFWLGDHEPEVPCDPEAALSRVWNDDARDRVHAAMRAASPAFADDLVGRFDTRTEQWTMAWSESFREMCNARFEWSPALADRAAACFERRLAELDTALVAATRIDAARRNRALDLIEDLRRPEPCAARDNFLAEVEPPDDPAVVATVAEIRTAIAEARARRIAGEFDGLDADLAAVVTRARDSAYPPVLAEALLEQGRLLGAIGKVEPAVVALEEAFYTATGAQHRHLALDAATDLVSAVGRDAGRPDAGMQWSRHGRALLGALPPDPEAAARLDWAVAELHSARNELPLARELFESALAVYDSRGLGHKASVVQASLGFVALRAGDLDEAARRLELARAEAFETLGAHHPDSAPPLVGLATVELRRDNLDAAAALMQQARTVYVDAFGPENVNVAGCMHNLGSIEQSRGDHAAARAVLEPTLALRERLLGPEHPDVAATLGLLGAVYEDMGELRLARGADERALAIAIATFGEDHLRVADILDNLGTLAIEEHDPRRGLASMQRALEIRLAAQGPEHDDVARTRDNIREAQALLDQSDAAARRE